MNIDVEREGADDLELIITDDVPWKVINKLISKQTLILLRGYLHKKMVDSQK